MNKVAIYARTATLEQTSKGDIDQQVKILKERIEKDGNRLEKDCIYCDAGFGGCQSKRPALLKLFKDARNNKFDYLYVTSPDRLSRNYEQLGTIFYTLKDFGITVIALNGSFSNSAEGMFITLFSENRKEQK